MKINVKEEYQLLIKIVLIVFALWLVIIWIIIDGYQQGQDIYFEAEQNALQSKVGATLKTYEVFSNYIFEEIINNEDVLSLMYQANHSEGKDQDAVRDELYNLLLKPYTNILTYNFRQLHFHLPNSDSFLRMHRPSKYGDSLIGIRESVRIANEEQKYVFGFEEGRIYNGYRFVYPLNYQEEAIGSVEVSLSMSTLVEILNQQYPYIDTYFMLNETIVKDKVFDDELSNYIEADYFNGYYYDQEVFQTSSARNKLLDIDNTAILFNQIHNDFMDLEASQEAISILSSLNQKNYLLQFLPVENISGKNVGYFLAVQENFSMLVEKRHLVTQCILVTLLMLFFVGSSFLYIRYQNQIKEISMRDKLTGLYNRHKFNEFAISELHRSKRYGSAFSLIMIDIDFFKKVNDTYGHLKGDSVLKELAELLLNTLRINDLVTRWGGEEFICCLPNTDHSQVIVVAEKIRQAVENFEFTDVGHITVSIGATVIHKDDDNLDAPIGRADNALYTSKNNGRNKSTIL